MQMEECAILRRNPSKLPPYFFLCENAENDQFLSKKVHGFPVRTPICHIVPMSRIYSPPPPKRRNFMGVGVFQQKEAKNARRP